MNQKEREKKISIVWYCISILFCFVGLLIAYFLATYAQAWTLL